MHLPLRRASVIGVSVALAVGGGAAAATAASAHSAPKSDPAVHFTLAHRTTTPIKHTVVIYQENVSFDHYFGTYPKAANTSGQAFTAKRGTPKVNGLTPPLLTSNPNGVNPARYDPANVSNVLTCDQDHNYSDEQLAVDGGKNDLYVLRTGNGGGTSPEGAKCVAGDVMNYYDGNTVTGFWNYAQQYAMSDNSFDTTYGPSSPGAINVISGDTGNVDTAHMANNPSVASSSSPNADLTADGLGGFSLTSDAQPYYDDCSTRDAVALSGKNIGDELNAKGISWGWFQGGFRPSKSYTDALAAIGQSGQSTSTFTPDEFSAYFSVAANRPAHSSNQNLCSTVTPVGVGLSAPLATGTGQYGYKDDYIPHHEPFQYYATTANPHHLTVPTTATGQDTLSGLATIGKDTQSYVGGVPQFNTPNHNYDSSDFDQLVAAISAHRLPASALPAVSYLKAPGWADGHAAYSDPLDEQLWVTKEINALMKSPDWASTAVIIAYDDSDGWYDHADPGVINPSNTVADAVTGPGSCGSGTPLAGEQGRCGYGPRQPLLVISPWAKSNFVDHTKTSQASVVKFIQQNWRLAPISGSFANIAGSLDNMFVFDDHGHFPGFDDRPDFAPFILNPATGQPVARRW